MARDDGAICPVCGKEFFPYPQHVYRRPTGMRVCSYSCMLKAQAIEVPKKGRVRYTVYCPDGFVAKSLNQAGKHMGITADRVLWMVKKGKIRYERYEIEKRRKSLGTKTNNRASKQRIKRGREA